MSNVAVVATPKVGINRLNKLLDLFENFDEKVDGKFDISIWAQELDRNKPKCGTAACALGWATTIPSFRKAGFRLVKDDSFSHGRYHVNLKWRPAYKDIEDMPFTAAAYFFGITTKDAEEAFDFDDSKVTRKQMISRLKNLIKKNEKRLAKNGNVPVDVY